ncbi:MAG: methyltransferase [Candidatus Diapherotrites archaeon]|nr:methyltransferase [Candidatus Diapherotrites archaeon]
MNEKGLLETLKETKEYKTISEETLKRVIKKNIEKYDNEKIAIKEIKKELYDLHNAYVKMIDYKRALKQLEPAYKTKSPLKIKLAQEKILKRYDGRRMKVIDTFYKEIFKVTGKPKSIIDLGCGMNPLTFPWMDLPEDTEYTCYDLDSEEIKFLNEYFELAGTKQKAIQQDIISKPVTKKADVAFLFKLITCLEWQEPGSAKEIVEKINAKYIVITMQVIGPGKIEENKIYLQKVLGKLAKDIISIDLKQEAIYIIKR